MDANANGAAGKRGRLRRIFSPLTLRILAVNLTAPVLLVLGLLFLDQYEDTLIAAELDALRTQGELMAASIGEGAVIISDTDAIPLFTPEGAMRVIDPDPARQLLRRQGTIARLRAQLFDRDGKLLADSRLLQGPGGEVQVQDLPPMESSQVLRFVHMVYDKTIGRMTADRTLEPYNDQMRANGPDIKEVMNALQAGEAGSSVRLRNDGQKILSVAVPVQFYKQIVGALLVSRDGSNVDKRMFAVRGSILGMFAWVLALTVLTSLFLAGTIARPVRRLATSAKRVRDSKNRQHTIPDLSKRNDEIGELSEALRDMTESLWRRMDATEHFAADVAHEIKNPLTSLRSAVETVGRVKDPEQQKRLMSIIMDDVARLDRLISEISDASRLDAEMSRAEMSPVKIKPLVQALSEVQNANDNPDAPRAQVIEDPAQKGDLTVFGLESRIGQVFRNLIGNASSFSPPQGIISIRAGRQGRYVIVTVEDQGPGLPEGKEAAIFGRFYSERPEGEKFGTHSGLGLSISKTIVEGHRGQIYAENIVGDDGRVKGARFVVLLPAAN
ncbi:MAG: stimulus-sensing domain-containing protein [Rhodospirillaceae bacterium]|nr:stimulus-sensing domain-containing protein [Rhodospirillaceae bacterium]